MNFHQNVSEIFDSFLEDIKIKNAQSLNQNYLDNIIVNKLKEAKIFFLNIARKTLTD